MVAPLSPAAMVVRAGMMHDDGDHLLDAAQMGDLFRVLDILPDDEAAIDAGWAELATDPIATPTTIPDTRYGPCIAFRAGPHLDHEFVGYGVQTLVDTSAERFGDAVTIAHLARYTFKGCSGAGLTAYRCIAMLRTDWRDELDSIIAEDRKGVNALFRDGSELRILTPGEYGKPVDPHWRAPART